MPWILTAWLQCNHFCKNRNTVVMSLEMSNACVANPNKIRASYQYITDIYWWGNCAQERHAEEQRLGGSHSGRLGITLLLFCDFFKERSKQKRFFWFIILSTPQWWFQLFLYYFIFFDIYNWPLLFVAMLPWFQREVWKSSLHSAESINFFQDADKCESWCENIACFYICITPTRISMYPSFFIQSQINSNHLIYPVIWSNS